jgi:hypothetical protein
VAVLERFGERLLREQHCERAAVVQRDVLADLPLFAQVVEHAHDLARRTTELGEIALELVDLFDHVDRDDHPVFLEREECVRIVKKHVGVEDEVLLQRTKLAPPVV